jgi:hypothetical protein
MSRVPGFFEEIAAFVTAITEQSDAPVTVVTWARPMTAYL